MKLRRAHEPYLMKFSSRCVHFARNVCLPQPAAAAFTSICLQCNSDIFIQRKNLTLEEVLSALVIAVRGRGNCDVMSKKRGLSLEEKRQRLLELFYEKKDFYQLKELEKIAPKEKGIVSQSVKEVLQALVDDNLVDTDKIGTSVYFWAFPSKAVNNRKRKVEEVTEKLSECNKKIKLTVDLVLKAQMGRENTAERDDKLKKLEEVKTQHEELIQEYKKYNDCDPEFLKEMDERAKIAKVAANRWTDNIFCLKSWCKNKFGMEEKALNQAFEIPEDLDYIE